MPSRNGAASTIYRPLARVLHWVMAVLIIAQLLAGIIMTRPFPEGSVAAGIVNSLGLYDGHKLLGVVLLALVLLRLIYRVFTGAPEDEPTLTHWQRESSHLVHAWVYFLLIAIPVTGWLGVSLYPALVAFGIKLPALVAPDQKASAIAFAAHAYLAFTLIALLFVHIGAALYHHFVRGDGVLRRMLPGLKPRDR